MVAAGRQVLRAPALTKGLIVMRATMLALASIASFWLATHLLGLYSVSRADDLLGGMWAVVSTIFVYRYSQAESSAVALSRMSATMVSFALCLAYLLVFPFHVLGMAVLIALGAIAVGLIGRPDDTITTTITIVVVLVVAATRGPDDAWRQPIFRLIDTAIGVTVGLVAVWLCEWALQATGHNRSKP